MNVNLEGFIQKNVYGNDELRINDGKGGHVTVILYAEDTRYCIGEVGMVASYTSINVGGSETIKTMQDIDKNIEGIKRIRRINDASKELLIEFLNEMRQYVKN